MASPSPSGVSIAAAPPAQPAGPVAPDRKQVLAAASPALAALLNVLPGLGSGYLYQRRWRAYGITAALAFACFVLPFLLAPQDGGSVSERITGLAGPLTLAVVTAAEAFLAGRRARMD